jgi:hypothetical protein
MKHLHVTEVNVAEVEELGVVVVSLVEDPAHPSRYLELSVMLQPSEADFAIGQATYSVTDEDGRCTYGGIRSWAVSNGSLELLLTDKAARELGVQEGFAINFPPELTSRVQDGVRRILEIAETHGSAL